VRAKAFTGLFIDRGIGLCDAEIALGCEKDLLAVKELKAIREKQAGSGS
jgi:hypothetical protein